MTQVNKRIISFIITIALLLSLLVGLKLLTQNQDIRKRATSTTASLSIYPTNQDVYIGQTREFDLILSFSGGSTNEKIDYFYTEVSFPQQYLLMPDNAYIETVQSGFVKIFRVDGPNIGNQTGRIVIELGALIPHTGPSTASPITVAKIFLYGFSVTPNSQNITLSTNTQVVNDRSETLSLTNNSGVFNVLALIPTQTPSVIPTISPNPTSTPIPTTTTIPTATRTPTPTITPTKTPTPTTVSTLTPTQTPISTLSPTPTSIPSPTQTQPSVTPIIPTITITPTPPPPTATLIAISCPRKSEGDANCDSIIDGVDYSTWLNNQCFIQISPQVCNNTSADFDNDNDVDDSDYDIWFLNRRR